MTEDAKFSATKELDGSHKVPLKVSTQVKHGILQDTRKECEQSSSSVDDSENTNHKGYGLPQEECQNSASIVNESEHARTGSRKLESPQVSSFDHRSE